MIATDMAVATLLSPVLLIQALRLRKNALRLPEAAGERTGQLGAGPLLRVLIVGDSSAAGVGADMQDNAFAGQLVLALAQDYTVNWHLIAQTGATTPSTLARFTSEPLPPTDVAVIVLGVNDVTRGGPMTAWLRNYDALRRLIRQATGARALYVAQIPPLGNFPLLPNPLRWVLGRRAIRFDSALSQAIHAEKGSHLVHLPEALDAADMAEDGFHPGPEIYRIWAQKTARQILSDGPHETLI